MTAHDPAHLILRAVVAFTLLIVGASIAYYLVLNVAGNGSLPVDILVFVGGLGLILAASFLGQLVIGDYNAN